MGTTNTSGTSPSGTSTMSNTTSSAKPSGKLPHTASPVPLLGLLGSGATAAGYWLSKFRRRR
jgi:LPXTG-motif cell wall-anchored protein